MPGLAASNSLRAFGRALSGAAPVWLTMTSEPVSVLAAFVPRTRGETRPERLATSATLPELCRNCRRVRLLRVFCVSIVWGCVELRLAGGPGHVFFTGRFAVDCRMVSRVSNTIPE